MAATLLGDGLGSGLDSGSTTAAPTPPPIPLSTPTENAARVTFTQLLWALSYPGRRMRLPGSPTATAQAATFNSCVAIGNTLLDLETSFFTPDAELSHALTRTGARNVTAPDAAYHFYPDLSHTQQISTFLAHAREASVGTLLYPDQAATLIVGCKLDAGSTFGDTLRLRGAGIASETLLTVGGIPAAFWQLREERVLYPIGWDLFLVDGDQVVGLPRTTLIEVDFTEGKA